MSSLAVSLTGWTALSAIGTLVLAVVTAAALAVTVWMAQTERRRDAELRRQDREREDQLRRDTDEKWERRRRDEQRQREDEDAQQQVTVEFLPGGPLSQAQGAVTTGDGITHRIIVRASAAYPIKWVGAEIGHRTNSGPGTIPTGWAFQPAVTENGEVRYTCFARVNPQVRDPAPIVRFADRNGNLYYSYFGYTRRFGQNTDSITAMTEIDKWIRTGPRPDEPDDGL
jgi:Ni/Co efflux regulator RcnB